MNEHSLKNFENVSNIIFDMCSSIDKFKNINIQVLI